MAVGVLGRREAPSEWHCVWIDLEQTPEFEGRPLQSTPIHRGAKVQRVELPVLPSPQQSPQHMAPSDDTNQAGSIARAAPASLLAFPFSPPFLPLFWCSLSYFPGTCSCTRIDSFWVPLGCYLLTYFHSVCWGQGCGFADPRCSLSCVFLAFVRWPYVDGFPGLILTDLILVCPTIPGSRPACLSRSLSRPYCDL